jgi:hypothetical protein
MVTIKVLKHSESGKSAFCSVSKRVGPFVSQVGVGYLYVDKGEELPVVGTNLPYSGEVDFADMVDETTGEARVTKDGVVLQRIVLK